MTQIRIQDLENKLARFWNLSGEKIQSIESSYDFTQGSPVFTQNGRYTTRGWTEWTEGFVYGSSILQFDATGDQTFLNIGRDRTVKRMAKHVSHIGVHDHGFNNVSTYGNLLRLMEEGKIPDSPWEKEFYQLALKCSGAVQAARWTDARNGDGFIYSFNGPHSLFADTIRSLRSLGMAHQLKHVLMTENDREVSLLERFLIHALTTSKYIVYFGEGRDSYDVPGRVVHEAVFNTVDGNFRCPSTQQGFSPFSTWTRGLAWIITGYAEELEFLAGMEENTKSIEIMQSFGGKAGILSLFLKTAQTTADFYLKNTGSDNIPYWDTGAPGLTKLGDFLNRPAEPFNDYEPVDSSAAAITAQGLLRLGVHLASEGTPIREGFQITPQMIEQPYFQAGLKILDTLLDDPYLSTDTTHQGLLLHSVYHRPNGWDTVPEGRKVPCGESSMWGDYHIREAALYLQRLLSGEPYYKYWLLQSM